MTDRPNTDRQPTASEIEQTQVVADELQATFRRLVIERGIDPALVLASAHSQILVELTFAFGGRFAAERARRAADWFQDQPSAHEAAQRGLNGPGKPL